MKKAELLRRKHLDDILEQIFDYPLTIVEAPMGYGKTTVVRNYLTRVPCQVLWISFLHGGESADWFWNKFSSVIGKVEEDLGSQLKTLGFPADMPQTDRVFSLMNQVSFQNKTVLVIDDCHLLTEVSVHRFLMGLVGEQIDQFHMVLITRDTTPLDFTELLSKGKCHIVSQPKLKFTEDEIREYCRKQIKNIPESEIQKITEYSDGWISLIYLILLGVESGIPVGMNDSINELVEKMLFKPYNQPIQRFLFKLSIMDLFTAKQAQFVTEEENALMLLKKLWKENAFVYYDSVNQTYKIHNVLLDFLRATCPFSAEEMQTLYGRLGEWYLAQGELQSAYGSFNRGGHVERILSVLNDPKNIRNELTLFEGSFELFETIPQNVLYQYPFAYLQHILLCIVYGTEETVQACAEKLKTMKIAFETLKGIDEEYRNRIIAEILIINKFTLFNQIAPDNEYNMNILRILNGKQSYIAQKENEFTFGSPHLLYIYFRDAGTLKTISEVGAISFKTYSQFANGCGTGSEYLLPAEYALETGDWETAETNSLRAIYRAETKDQTSIIICANFTLMRLHLLKGNVQKALERLKQLEASVTKLNNSIYNTTLDMCKGYLYGCLGQGEKIPLWLQTGYMSVGDLLYEGVAFNYIVYGKAVLLSKNYVALDVLTESFQEKFSIFSNRLGAIHNQIFKAIAQYHLMDTENGVMEMEGALRMAEADGILMPFIEYAPYILGLLKLIENRDSQNGFIKRMIRECEGYADVLKNNHPTKLTLSQREVEVLSLTASGLKREAIAEQLQLSQGTVKTHLQNIYSKLEVSGKTAAIKKAQLHGFIQ